MIFPQKEKTLILGMEQIDKLALVSKSLFDHRVLEQRREIEQLKKKTLNNYYLVVFLNDGSRTCEMTLIQSLNEGDEFQTIAKMKDMKELYNELNKGSIQTTYNEIDMVKELIKFNEIILIKLDDLIGHSLSIDPKYHEISVTKKEH